MTLQAIGAGVGRTGTMSLKLALEQLLGGPCYHMIEVFPRSDHVEQWHRAVRGEDVDWETLFGDFTAAVDWPASAFWQELSAVYPDAIIIHSVRDSADAWWRSADRTIFEAMDREPEPDARAWWRMADELIRATFTGNYRDEQEAKIAYEAHNAYVREHAPARRLVEWQPSDGWGPICESLDMPVPDEPFPRANTAEEFRQMTGLD